MKTTTKNTGIKVNTSVKAGGLGQTHAGLAVRPAQADTATATPLGLKVKTGLRRAST